MVVKNLICMCKGKVRRVIPRKS